MIILKKISIGIVIGLIFTTILVKNNHTVLGEIILYDTLPYYEMNENMLTILKVDNPKNSSDKSDEILDSPVFINNDKSINSTDNTSTNNIYNEIIGINDIEYEDEGNKTPSENNDDTVQTKVNIEELRDLNTLKNKFYIVDKKTGMNEKYFNVDKFINTDLSIEKNTKLPKVLIFHTHSSEKFKDSNPNDKNNGIVGAGAKLANLLENTYGIKTLHVTESFDNVNGKTQINGAYSRMEPKINQILKENPSIELVIDLHRDGVNENVRLAKNINGKPTAQIMFFNGLCQINENGKLKPTNNLSNPYLETNLALSFNMQKHAIEKYGGQLTRKIYLNAYRYSLHLAPKTLLIELGAQTNTEEEVTNAITLLADMINSVIFE